MELYRHFVFNSFGVNAWVLQDETGKCLLIDPACHSDREEKQLATYLADSGLTPVALINTHFHIDHFIGNTRISKRYGLKPMCHAESRLFWETASEFGSVFGINVDDLIIPSDFLTEGHVIPFGNSSVEVLYTPGHADGSISLVNHHDAYVVTGDVLFFNSIGRTDLPTGNFELLLKSIRGKLFTLPDNFKVLPGHGPETTIGHEKACNPFLR
jgi:glyoxylase-like metal-dependent hydrolase (beta-lactamase superfamily II)